MLRPIVAIAILLWASLARAQDAHTWKAGVAKVKITPEKLMWMSGYGARDKPAEGKLTDLWAKALALEDAKGRRGLLITMDLVGIDRGLSLEVCAELKKKHGLPREAIILSVSHTHCGPVVRSNLNVMYDLDETQQKYVAEYAALLKQRLIEVADAAVKELQPARLSWGIGQATFAVNRRNNIEKDVPKLRAAGKLKGPVDHDVPVLAVRDRDDKVLAVAFGYACHATVLSFYQWCGDYPGYAQAELEKMYPGATALFWAGCGGDQNPLPRRSVELAKVYGAELADAVKRVLGAPMSPLGPGFAATYTEVPLRFAELPAREKLAEDVLSKNKTVARRAGLLLARLDKEGALTATYPYPIQIWRLDATLVWIALGGEVVVDYALRLKREASPGRTWIMGYANDVMAYIPSLRVLKEGGYEGGGAMVFYGLPTVWGPRVEEMIVAAVHERAKQIRQR
ncbi:MAG TPA: neutral/alkaline non-lysosomal ceramidase N-terminal domain-containing protein [Gemmataceae bacterium]|nr:neutral/alkaline non-lysosomal ceramidase N-terminal domain-containing protein [Gemmataceae bacterium]